MSILTCDNISYAIGVKEILSDVTFAVNPEREAAAEFLRTMEFPVARNVDIILFFIIPNSD